MGYFPYGALSVARHSGREGTVALRTEEIRNWSDEELRNRLEQIRRELFNLRIQWAMNQLKDVNRIRALRKDIARILTIMRERELARGGRR